MKKNWSICILVLVSSFLFGQQAINPVSHFDQFNGLPAKILYKISKDNKGFLWLSAENGVFRFDGKSFYTYTTKEGLCDNEIVEIFADKRGRIWCSGYNGQISVIDKGVVDSTYDFVKNWNSKGFIHNITGDDEGNIYLAGEQLQVFKIDANNNVYDLGYDITKNVSRDLIIYNNTLFVLCDFKIIKYDPKTGFPNEIKIVKKHQFEKVFVSDDYPVAWIIDSVGRIINLFDGEQITLNVPRSSEVSYITQIDQQFLLIYYFNEGTFLYDLRQKNYREINIPKDAGIADAVTDNQGNIWIVTGKNGLYAIRYEYDNPIDKPLTGFEGNIINACKYKNEILAVTSQGELIISRDGIIEKVSLKSTIASNRKTAYANLIKAKNYVLIATDNGLHKYKNGQLDYLSTGGKEMYIYNDTNLFIRHSLRLMQKTENSGEQYELIAAERTYSMCLQDKKLWISSKAGLKFYDLNTKTLSEIICKVPNEGRIEDIGTWDNHITTFCTSNRGVFFYGKQFGIKNIAITNGLFDNDCKEIDSCQAGWIVRHPLGLSLLSSTQQVRTVSQWRGIPISSVNNISVFGDTIFLSSSDGLIMTNLSSLFEQFEENRKVEFLQISSDGELLLPKNINLKYNKNKLKIDFALPEYNQPNLIQYYWRINKENWNKASTTTLEFADLQSGEYQLEIIAKAPGFIWTKVSRLQFVVETPFWKTPIFIAIGIILLLSGFGAWQRNRFRKKLAIEKEKASVQHQLMSHEQRALNAMMNPHFVFNAMGSIQYLLNAGYSEQANNYLVKFSRLIRKTLETSQAEFCFLDDEIERMTLYLELEKMRLEGKMSFEIEIQETLDIEQNKIPTMILQTFLENAIIHGISGLNRKGVIKISFTHDETNLFITIEDNGLGFDTNDLTKQSKRFGLSATKKRLELLTKISKEMHLIKIISPSTASGGTKVSLQFPIIT